MYDFKGILDLSYSVSFNIDLFSIENNKNASIVCKEWYLLEQDEICHSWTF